MRKLVIILAVFVLLFATVLIWGVARDRDPPAPGSDQAINCNGLPKTADGEVDTERMEEWKEACAPKRAENSANRFSRGIKLRPGSLDLTSGEPRDWPVQRAKDEESAQQVKLTLASGALVKIDASPEDSDVDDQAICLCSGSFNKDQIEKCDSDWRKVEGMLSWSGSGQSAKATCSNVALRGKLFFGPKGGTIRLEAIAGSAEVSSAK